MTTVTVSKDGKGVFTSIAAALDYIKARGARPAKIYIKKGEYRERLSVFCPDVTLEGESCEETVITGDAFADRQDEKGVRLGTFRTATLFVGAQNITLKNLTVKNTAGKVGQALALYVDGDSFCALSCRLCGFQDTVFVGGLPQTAFNDTPHAGIKQYFTPPDSVKQYGGLRSYFKNCYIQGDVDFIFGSATALFDRCVLYSAQAEAGYVAAPSTPEGQKYGLVFSRCFFVGSAPEGSVFIARPWRKFGKTALLDCYLGPHIAALGYSDWDKTYAHSTVGFCECGSYGESGGTSGRAPFVKLLSPEEKELFNPRAVLGDFYYEPRDEQKICE